MNLTTTPVSGFGPGTIVMTTDGEMPVEWLAPGDKMITRDHGAQPILWMGRMRGTTPEGAPLPDPVVLYPGDGPVGDSPIERLRLAPGHRAMLRLPDVQLHHGTDEALARVSDLSRRYSKRPDPNMGGLVYHHILMEQHELVNAGGLWVETVDAEMALRLDVPDWVRKKSRIFDQSAQTARMCLTRDEAQMIRQSAPQDMSLLDLLVA